MKPHLIIKLNRSLPIVDLPYWGEVTAGRAEAPDSFYEPVDNLLRKHDIAIRATREYAIKGVQEESKSGLTHTYRLISKDNITFPETLMSQLRMMKEVENVEKGDIQISGLPKMMEVEEKNDFLETIKEQIGLPKIYDQYTKGHRDIVVAVLDTGQDLQHPELSENVRSGKDFVDITRGAGKFIGDFLGGDEDPTDNYVGHGTHVAGIIAAKGIEMAPGIAPGCSILPVRVLGAMRSPGGKAVGAGLIHNINNGIKWAVDQGADIINMSLGVLRQGAAVPHQDAIAYAHRNGVTVLAASGNDGSSRNYYPAGIDSTIAVGALDEQKRVAYFSNFGRVTLLAPGVNIYSSYIQGRYSTSSGTSQATPFVAGIVALMKSYAYEKIGPSVRTQRTKKQLINRLVRYSLENTAKPLSDKKYTRKAGYGYVMAYDAFQLFTKILKFNFNY